MATESKRPTDRRAIPVENLTDAEMDAIMNSKVPAEHDYDYADDSDLLPPARPIKGTRGAEIIRVDVCGRRWHIQRSNAHRHIRAINRCGSSYLAARACLRGL
jgi:hypothetical protein